MSKLTHIFVLSCKKATLLIEKSNGSALNPLQRVQLALHLKICDGCLNYQKQSRIIEELLKNDPTTLTGFSGLKLSDKSKELIQRAIDEKTRKK